MLPMSFADSDTDFIQHVLSLPSFQSLRVYHAHSASVSSISISPFPPPPPTAKPEAVNRLNNQSTPMKSPPSMAGSGMSPRSQKTAPPVPATPSNSIYIATSSIDGNVCVASLVDQKDVTLRNFGRPVQSVALSMDFRRDRSYLSGGLAGSLVLSTGGRAGTSENCRANWPCCKRVSKSFQNLCLVQACNELKGFVNRKTSLTFNRTE